MEVLLAMLDTIPCLRMHPSEANQKKCDESHKTIIVKINQGTCY